MLADTYRVPGNYVCIDNTIASTLKNCPISKAFILKVDLSTGNAYPRQTFLQFNNGKVFTRVFDAFENKWSETFSNITNTDINKNASSRMATGSVIVGSDFHQIRLQVEKSAQGVSALAIYDNNTNKTIGYINFDK